MTHTRSKKIGRPNVAKLGLVLPVVFPLPFSTLVLLPSLPLPPPPPPPPPAPLSPCPLPSPCSPPLPPVCFHPLFLLSFIFPCFSQVVSPQFPSPFTPLSPPCFSLFFPCVLPVFPPCSPVPLPFSLPEIAGHVSTLLRNGICAPSVETLFHKPKCKVSTSQEQSRSSQHVNERDVICKVPKVFEMMHGLEMCGCPVYMNPRVCV